MCVIATHPAGKPLTKEHTLRMWRSNSDGAGFAYVGAKGSVIVKKGFMDYESFQAAYEKAIQKYGNDSPFVVHFRIRTHGKKDAERTHPFYATVERTAESMLNRPAVAHNGFISCVPDHPEKSDTQLFVERYPKFFSTKENLKAAIEAGLGDSIGSSKLAILYPDKTIMYVNDKWGSTDNEGRWYSNSTWDHAVYQKSEVEGKLLPLQSYTTRGSRAFDGDMDDWRAWH